MNGKKSRYEAIRQDEIYSNFVAGEWNPILTPDTSDRLARAIAWQGADGEWQVGYQMDVEDGGYTDRELRLALDDDYGVADFDSCYALTWNAAWARGPRDAMARFAYLDALLARFPMPAAPLTPDGFREMRPHYATWYLMEKHLISTNRVMLWSKRAWHSNRAMWCAGYVDDTIKRLEDAADAGAEGYEMEVFARSLRHNGRRGCDDGVWVRGFTLCDEGVARAAFEMLCLDADARAAKAR